MLVVALSFGRCILLEHFIYRRLSMSDNKNILFKELSHTIIGIAMKVHTRLGGGLPEHCYTRSMAIELDTSGIPHSTEHKVEVSYNDKLVGHLIPDIVVDNKVILEFKIDQAIYPHHLSQLMSYMSATHIRVGYVLNFGNKSSSSKDSSYDGSLFVFLFYSSPELFAGTGV
jgi:GxxExxY protein